jgi:hypothetical protein
MVGIIFVLSDQLQTAFSPLLNLFRSQPLLSITFLLIVLRAISLKFEILTPKIKEQSDKFNTFSWASFRRWGIPIIHIASMMWISHFITPNQNFEIDYVRWFDRPEGKEYGPRTGIFTYTDEAMIALIGAVLLCVLLIIIAPRISVFLRKRFCYKAEQGLKIKALLESCTGSNDWTDNELFSYRVIESLSFGIAFFFLILGGAKYNYIIIAFFIAIRLLSLPLLEYLTVRSFVVVDQKLTEVERLTDLAALIYVAKNNKNKDIRNATIENPNFTDQPLLAEIAKNDKDIDVRGAAVRKITDTALLTEIAKIDINWGGKDWAKTSIIKDAAKENFHCFFIQGFLQHGHNLIFPNDLLADSDQSLVQ